MPDGGISPCVIRVLGVGGGGCNAVSLNHVSSAVPCIPLPKLNQENTYNNMGSSHVYR